MKIVTAVCNLMGRMRRNRIVSESCPAVMVKRETLEDSSELTGSAGESYGTAERMEDVLYRKILSYMEGVQPYLNDDFCLDDLAREVYSNKAYVSRTVNDKSGMNFRRFVNSYRVEYAKKLIENDLRLKVVEVSMMSGFHSVASFNSAFRILAGTTPSEYIRDRQAECFLSQ